MEPAIHIEQQKLADYCRRHGIQKLSFFGSVLTADFGPDSDVDVLVEFKVGQVPGFLRLGQMEEELSVILGGRKVDLVTLKALNHRIRTTVLKQARVQYAEG
ncbi:MAG: nucleotidyltransferase family protein [Pseudomonadota bacterium]